MLVCVCVCACVCVCVGQVVLEVCEWWVVSSFSWPHSHSQPHSVAVLAVAVYLAIQPNNSHVLTVHVVLVA